MLERTAISLVIVLLFMVAAFVFWDQPIFLGIGVLVGFAGLAATWTINRPTKSVITGQSGDLGEVDTKAGQLIAGLQKGNTAKEQEKIGKLTQQLILETRKDLKSGKFKNAKAAVEDLGKRSVPKDAAQKKVAMLAVSLACTYLLADAAGPEGEQTVGRVNNFIAGLADQSLDKKKSAPKKKTAALKKNHGQEKEKIAPISPAYPSAPANPQPGASRSGQRRSP